MRCFAPLIVVFTIASLAGLSNPTRADDAELAATRRFLQQHCADCHSGDEPAANLALDVLAADFGNDDTADAWSKVLSHVRLGLMPPADEPRPDPLLVDQFAGAIDAALVGAGRASVLHELTTHPQYGNYVDHDLLFSGNIKGPAYSPSRIWRRSGYNAAVGEFALPARTGIRDYAAEGQVDEPTLNSLIAAIDGVLTRELEGATLTSWQGKSKTLKPKTQYVDYLQAAEPTAELARGALDLAFREALQRAPRDVELQHYQAMLEALVAKGGRKIGLKTTLMAIFLNPEAIFRMELGLGEALLDGRRMLSPQEIYFAVSLALADAPLTVNRKTSHPDHIRNIMAGGGLKSYDDVRRAVKHLLSNDEIDKPRIDRFFHEFFSFQEAETIFKDGQTSYGQRGYMMNDAEAFIRSILVEDQNVFAQLLTKTEYPLTVVRGKRTYTWPMLEFSYSLDKQEQQRLEAVYLTATTTGPKNERGKHDFVPAHDGPAGAKNGRAHWDFAGERAGLLCHPTWLFAWSTNIENQPVQRGKWVLENLLAGTMAEVPITVQAQVPEDPHRTLRERFAETSENQYCWNCHKKMNPLGMTFEVYDYMGSFRTTEVGKQVDAGADFEGTGIPVLDEKKIKVKNAVELMEVLAREPRVRQSIIRHAFRYFLGRNEMLSDSPTLIAADQAYVASGGSFKAVIESLLTSDSFLLRK